MSKIADLTLKGISGNSYKFVVYPLGTSFKPVGGVYYISKRIQSGNKGNHTAIYIGQTGDLSERFENHHKATCFESYYANCISVHVNNSKDERLLIEKDLIASLQPPCNG